LYLWWTTGSPVFPHYNALFHSTLFPQINIGDTRFGPTSRLDALLWPLVSALHPERLSELGVASGRFALACLAALASVVASRRARRLASSAFIVLVGSLLWSASSGNPRYGLSLEPAGGLVLVLLAASARRVRLLAWPLLFVFGAQSVLAVRD